MSLNLRRRLFPLAIVCTFALVAGCDSAIEENSNALLAYWSFNDEFTVDNSGNGNDAISHGAAAEEGVIGMSANLLGSSYLEIEDTEEFDSFERTVSFWFYKSTDGLASDFEPMLWKATDQDPDLAFSFTLTNDDAPFRSEFRVGDGTSEMTTIRTDSMITPGRWYHVVGVSSPIESTLYVNGELVGAAQNNGAVARNNAPILIGRSLTSSGSERYFNGRIDEVRIYGRSLDLKEVQLLYQDGK